MVIEGSQGKEKKKILIYKRQLQELNLCGRTHMLTNACIINI